MATPTNPTPKVLKNLERDMIYHADRDYGDFEAVDSTRPAKVPTNDPNQSASSDEKAIDQILNDQEGIWVMSDWMDAPLDGPPSPPTHVDIVDCIESTSMKEGRITENRSRRSSKWSVFGRFSHVRREKEEYVDPADLEC